MVLYLFIGTYVDRRIIPGFRYRVRIMETNRWQFGGEAKTLAAIGKGYAKRLTFKADSLVDPNGNYFYSDTSDTGFAFSIECFSSSARFTVQNEEGRAVGMATVEETDVEQHEISSFAARGRIEKKVQVSFSCSLHFSGSHGGMMSLYADTHSLPVQGLATVVKEKGLREAITVTVQDVMIPLLGRCLLVRE